MTSEINYGTIVDAFVEKFPASEREAARELLDVQKLPETLQRNKKNLGLFIHGVTIFFYKKVQTQKEIESYIALLADAVDQTKEVFLQIDEFVRGKLEMKHTEKCGEVLKSICRGFDANINKIFLRTIGNFLDKFERGDRCHALVFLINISNFGNRVETIATLDYTMDLLPMRERLTVLNTIHMRYEIPPGYPLDTDERDKRGGELEQFGKSLRGNPEAVSRIIWQLLKAPPVQEVQAIRFGPEKSGRCRKSLPARRSPDN